MIIVLIPWKEIEMRRVKQNCTNTLLGLWFGATLSGAFSENGYERNALTPDENGLLVLPSHLHFSTAVGHRSS